MRSDSLRGMEARSNQGPSGRMSGRVRLATRHWLLVAFLLLGASDLSAQVRAAPKEDRPAGGKKKDDKKDDKKGGGLLEGLFGGSEKDDEIWAVRCITYQGADQFQRAERVAEALKKVNGLKADLVQVLADDEGTSVYYGRYKHKYASGDKEDRFEPDAKRDLELIRKLQPQGSDDWPFLLATMDALPNYRSSNPTWDLNNADGYWTLHVAVFYNTETMSGRRRAAEEYCRILREQGEQAYFHHGTSNSSVYIGAFPKSSVQAVKQEDAVAGQVTTVNRIIDPKLRELSERFPRSLHNGHEMYEVLRDPKSGEVQQRVPTPSFLAVMPKARQLEAAREKRP